VTCQNQAIGLDLSRRHASRLIGAALTSRRLFKRGEAPPANLVVSKSGTRYGMPCCLLWVQVRSFRARGETSGREASGPALPCRRPGLRCRPSRPSRPPWRVLVPTPGPPRFLRVPPGPGTRLSACRALARGNAAARPLCRSCGRLDGGSPVVRDGGGAVRAPDRRLACSFQNRIASALPAPPSARVGCDKAR
jgi:hypothetical protein